MGILVGFLVGLIEMDNNSGYFSLMLIVIYWWLVKLLPVLENRIFSLFLAPPWSGQGDNTGYCGIFTVQEFPHHHQHVGVMVTYLTTLVLMSWLLCLLCDGTPVHPIGNLDHEQERSNSVNLMREVTGQLQPAPNYLREHYNSDGYCISSVFAQAVLLRILFHAILHVHLWYKPCATQMVTIPECQSPTFAPLDLNGDRKWIANVNAFLLDHDPS